MRKTCLIMFVQKKENSDLLFEKDVFAFKSIAEAKRYLKRLSSHLTKKKVVYDNWLQFYEIRFDYTENGYSTTNERWFIK